VRQRGERGRRWGRKEEGAEGGAGRKERKVEQKGRRRGRFGEEEEGEEGGAGNE
jgi:hypothetical protein